MGDTMVPPTEMIIAATCDAERAGLILRLPTAPKINGGAAHD